MVVRILVAALAKILLIHILHACERVLLFEIASNICRASLIESTCALEPLVVGGSVVGVRCLPLASAMLQQLVLVPQADHVVLMIELLLHAVLDATLGRPRVDQRLLVVRLLLLGVQRLAVASRRHFAEIVTRELSRLISTLSCILLVTSTIFGPVPVIIMDISRLFMSLLKTKVVTLLLASTSFLAAG